MFICIVYYITYLLHLVKGYQDNMKLIRVWISY